MIAKQTQRNLNRASASLGGKRKCKTHHLAAVALVCSFAYGMISWSYLSQARDKQSHHNNRQSPSAAAASSGLRIQQQQQHQNQQRHHGNNNDGTNFDACAFRQYPPHRYYELTAATQPEFLTSSQQTEYIYGQWPRILPQTSDAVKLCVDQSSWLGGTTTKNSNRWPFADGTNPSILSVERIRQTVAAAAAQSGSGSSNSDLQAFLASMPSNVVWLATACMTNSQCQWKDTPDQVETFRLSTQSKPDTVRTILFLLDQDFAPITQSTIYLEMNHNWGKRGKQVMDKNSPPYRRPVAFDDARLFVHDGQVWISYREGPGFGYESQVLNPLHFMWDKDNTASKDEPMTVTAIASETTFFCCGRNMALMANLNNSHQLMSLTWVDPVTVERVDTAAQPVPLPRRKNNQHRRLSLMEDLENKDNNNHDQHNHDRRRLKEKAHKSHIHGTNAFMVYLPQRDEFLGVAHFHRPNDRAANLYARFGHHYTHAFFTVTAREPYHLTALSSEFVYASPSLPSDAEIIQFSSGLEVAGDQVILAYGINDCEAALTTVPWSVVESWLQPVDGNAGKEVVHFMRPLAETTSI